MFDRNGRLTLEPELLRFRRKPSSNVILRKKHKPCFVFTHDRDGDAIDRVGGIRLTKDSTLTIKATSNGLQSTVSTGIRHYSASSQPFVKTSDGTGTGDFCMLAIVAEPDSTQAYAITQRRNLAADYRQIMGFRFGGYWTTGTATYNTQAGTVYFGTYEATPKARGVWAANVVDGNEHVWLGVRRGGVFELYRDGELLATNDQSANIVDVYSSDQLASLGGVDTSQSADRHIDLQSLSVAFDYAPTQADCVALSRNPWAELFDPVGVVALKTPVAAIAAPTATIYGPLTGPLGGPV